MLSAEADAILNEMYSASTLQGANGPVEIDQITKVDEVCGAELNRLVRENGTTNSLEIGLAYGFSTIWIMDALAPEGEHIALDPFQSSLWHGVGATQARRLSSKRFNLIEDYSIHALSDFIRADKTFDSIFIDGNHRFDDVLVDFYLADQVLSVGGLMVLDDTWMASIRTVVAFVLANRAYEVVPQRSDRMAALRKLKDDDRDWRHFRPFPVVNKQTGGLANLKL
jgi:predicted O-methyltransferase YrrM